MNLSEENSSPLKNKTQKHAQWKAVAKEIASTVCSGILFGFAASLGGRAVEAMMPRRSAKIMALQNRNLTYSGSGRISSEGPPEYD